MDMKHNNNIDKDVMVRLEDINGQSSISSSRGILKHSLWTLMLISGTLIYGTYSVLVHLCEIDGKIPFSSASVILVTEILKLIICICCYIPNVLKDGGFELPTLVFSIPFAVPAVLYCINNNMALLMQVYMDPTTYQVLGNMKIVTTAVLFRIIIKKKLSGTEWFSIFLLTVAGVIDSYGGLETKAQERPLKSSIHITVAGLVMISMYCFISGLAGVYTEYILKRHYQISLYFQNGLLYSFGILLNGGVWISQELQLEDYDIRFNMFRGYSIYTWAIVITQTALGLIMSAVMKHADNITRLFIISTSMIVNTALSLIVFKIHLNIYFFISFSIILLALYLYHRK